MNTTLFATQRNPTLYLSSWCKFTGILSQTNASPKVKSLPSACWLGQGVSRSGVQRTRPVAWQMRRCSLDPANERTPLHHCWAWATVKPIWELMQQPTSRRYLVVGSSGSPYNAATKPTEHVLKKNTFARIPPGTMLANSLTQSLCTKNLNYLTYFSKILKIFKKKFMYESTNKKYFCNVQPCNNWHFS
jgi:hypothetical protein